MDVRLKAPADPCVSDFGARYPCLSLIAVGRARACRSFMANQRRRIRRRPYHAARLRAARLMASAAIRIEGESDADGDADRPASRRPCRPVIGRVIGGNFRVLKLIGAGAMGHVFQAEQLSLGKMVALKLLRSELMGDEKLIKRFELEAKSASSAGPPQLDPDHRLRARRRSAVHRHGAAAGGGPRPAHPARGPAAAGAHRPDHGPGAGGAGRGPRPRHRPPRSQARQHHAGLAARTIRTSSRSATSASPRRRPRPRARG